MAEPSPAVVKAADIAARTGTAYPPQYAAELKGREKRLLGDLFGLSQFGVNLLGGEHRMSAGMCAGFKAGVPNAHHLVNRSDKPAVCLELGTRAKDERAHYADIDMKGVKSDGAWSLTRRDGATS